MRTGSRLLVISVLLFAALSSRAFAADTLSVYVDNSSISLGSGTQIAAHAEKDDAYGGGHVAFKYKPADQDCAPTAAEDAGTDATGEQPTPVAAGPGAIDVAGQPLQLDVGNWRICGWLLDDANATVVASASTIVEVRPYEGSLSISIKRFQRAVQFTLGWSTSAPAYFYAAVQRARLECPRSPAKIRKGSVLLVPRSGRFVGSDGGLGRLVRVKDLAPGRWRVCTWLQADVGSVGPASKTFALPRR